jgi:hypothetical protein
MKLGKAFVWGVIPIYIIPLTLRGTVSFISEIINAGIFLSTALDSKHIKTVYLIGLQYAKKLYAWRKENMSKLL